MGKPYKALQQQQAIASCIRIRMAILAPWRELIEERVILKAETVIVRY